VAKESADVILMDDNFTTIVTLAKWGRGIYLNIQKFVQFQLPINIVSLMISFVSICILGSSPFTVVQLLWVNMIMDILGALALATEPPNDGLMNRFPVGRGASFITGTMWKNIIAQSIYQLAVFAILKFGGKKFLKLNGSNVNPILNTLIFNSFVFSQVFNAINSRAIENINVFHGLVNSWVFIVTMVSIITSQVIMVEFLGTFASTVPLSAKLWLVSILIGSGSMIVAVALKCISIELLKNADTVQYNDPHDGYDPLPCG
ncbi:hypothetical protein GIB67_018247, partial [Kingdonia uniflora]